MDKRLYKYKYFSNTKQKMVKISFKIPSSQQPLTLDVDLAKTNNIEKLKIRLGE